MADFELPLRTDRLLLRPFEADDFPAFNAFRSRPDVARYLYWGPETEAEVRAALQKRIASRAIDEEGDFLGLAIVVRATDELVGDVILGFMSAEHRTCEVGFIVHPDHHGRGYATEAGRRMLAIAFDDLDMHRVCGRTEARNVASARLLEKLGMRREAHFVENEFVKGEWQSELVYAILDREWRTSPAR
jgi:RimJ/RimL family protein N-acetyltransferase